MLRRLFPIAALVTSAVVTPLAAQIAQIAPAAGAEAVQPRSSLDRSSAAAAFHRPPSAIAVAPPEAARDTARRVPLDLRIAAQLRSSGVQRNGAMRAAARVFDSAAIPGTLFLAAAIYGVGRVQDDAGLSDLGLHTGQAIAVAGGVSLAGKVIVGRARPRISPQDPHDVQLGRGLHGNPYQSFPSAHTAVAFATAAVMAAELPGRLEDPSGWVAPAAYAGAAVSAVSRLYYDEHWASDILAGAIVGTLSGFVLTN
ncbi:MAG: phosphatase PAP2 family protein [Gemmatimonadota bacterium]